MSRNQPEDMIDLTEETLPKSAVLCAVQTPDVSDVEFRESLGELARLAKTLGLTVRGEVTQRRGTFDNGTYLGTGRVADLKALVNVDPEQTLVLVDHEISPSQARNLEKETECAGVLDRTAVILEIFHRHANSRQARMQVEMVRLVYMAPRMRESRKGSGDRARGGIGGKGAGESSMELDRRKIRDRVAEIQQDLEALAVERRTQRSRRQSVRRVALCGYTNAGKSTLFFALTQSEVYIADKLFATLDTTVRVLQPEARPRVLVSDTVGFIRNLPTKLVDAFKSTLEEALEASLILHVVDAADPACLRHMETTNAVLREIGAAEIPQIIVFNKADKLPDLEAGRALQGQVSASAGEASEAQQQVVGTLVVSAHDPADVARVRQAVVDYFDRQLVTAELILPYDRQELRGDIFTSCNVLKEDYAEDGAHLQVRCEPAVLAQLQRRLGVLPDEPPPEKSWGR